jgi:hypothetical protein
VSPNASASGDRRGSTAESFETAFRPRRENHAHDGFPPRCGWRSGIARDASGILWHSISEPRETVRVACMPHPRPQVPQNCRNRFGEPAPLSAGRRPSAAPPEGHERLTAVFAPLRRERLSSPDLPVARTASATPPIRPRAGIRRRSQSTAICAERAEQEERIVGPSRDVRGLRSGIATLADWSQAPPVARQT